MPCALSPVRRSSKRGGTRVTGTPSLNESVTYPASVCCLLSKEGTAHISGFHFLPLSLPTSTSASLLFKLLSAVRKAPRKRLEGGPGAGRRGRCETPPQTMLHCGAKLRSPGKTAFQRRVLPPRPRSSQASVPASGRPPPAGLAGGGGLCLKPPGSPAPSRPQRRVLPEAQQVTQPACLHR